MFDFLTSGVSAGVTMANMREWAGEIANSFFNANALPTDTLTKIARSEELSPHQIQVLAGEANKYIHTHKYASAEEKYHAADFPLADAKQAIASLQLDGGSIKVAAHFVDPIFEDKGPDAYEMFGIKPEVLDKTASVKHQVKTAEEKLELLKQKLDDKSFMLKSAYEKATYDFIKMARQCLIEESNSADRMKVLGQLDQFVKIAKSKSGKKLLAKVAFVLMKEGKLEPSIANRSISYFTKEADEKAPQELISDRLPTQVINGDHPLYITLKTVGDLEAQLLRHEQEGLLVQDKLKILKQRARAL